MPLKKKKGPIGDKGKVVWGAAPQTEPIAPKRKSEFWPEPVQSMSVEFDT